jgi:O-antigen/teichoic acid export membrane protein
MSKKKLLGKLSMIGFGTVFQILSSFSTAIVAYFIFAKHDEAIWGQFAANWMVISWLSLLFNFGCKEALLKEFSTTKAKPTLLCKQNMSARLPLLIICILALLVLKKFSQSLTLIPILIASFIVNSFQPLFIFEKRFKLLFITEILALGTQLLFLFKTKTSLHLNFLLLSFLMYLGIKIFSILFIYRRNLIPQMNFIFYPAILKSLGPFFLLALGGMLVNKADLMVVTAQLGDTTKAQYHIISTFSSVGIVGAHALLQPFIKQVYRINIQAFNKIALSYFLWGVIISMVYSLCLLALTDYFFNFELSYTTLILVYFIELIFFAINPMVFYIFRIDKQNYFVVLVLIAGFFSLLFAFVFVKPFGIEGALFSNFTGNFILLALLWITKRYLKERELLVIK